MTVATTAPANTVYDFQGIEVPAASVRPGDFFEATTRHINPERTPVAYAGLGLSDHVTFKRADILAQAVVRFVGTLTITLNGGTAASTGRWPYDLMKRATVNANGQSGLIKASGWKFKARDIIARAGELDDRGQSQIVGGVARTQGTLATDGDLWGVGSQTTGLVGGAFPVDLSWVLPICDDEVDLAGALYLATTQTDVELDIDWNTVGSLFALTGGATAVLTGNFDVQSVKYSIPEDDQGLILPDLSLFHQFIENRDTKVANGDNEIRLAGQGPGKTLLRILYQLWNNINTATEAPVPMTTVNFGPQSYTYATSETPDKFQDGGQLRRHNARWYNADIGGLQGFGVHEFASMNALRDVLDMSNRSELRFNSTVANGVALVAPAWEYVQEIMFRAGAGG
jgi:hypothetical protein